MNWLLTFAFFFAGGFDPRRYCEDSAAGALFFAGGFNKLSRRFFFFVGGFDPRRYCGDSAAGALFCSAAGLNAHGA